MELSHMAAVLIRNLPEATHRALKRRAKSHGRSTEAEIRDILEQAVKPKKKVGLGDELVAFGQKFGGIELEIPPRTDMPEPASFE
jgi:plasmid stability protein